MNKRDVTCLFLVLLLSSCTSSAPADIPIATETYVAVDGATTANAFTWEDINSNGVPDEGETPISFVTTSVAYPDFLTGTYGWGIPWEFMPGCVENCWEGESVYVKVPPGFRPTTPTEYELSSDDGNYYFGFYVDNENQVISFPNEPDWQKAFINRGAKILAFHYVTNGQLQITVDRDGTIADDYYPEEFLTGESYFDVFIFDIVLYLERWHEVAISDLQITVEPSDDIFTCKMRDIHEWDGKISGYEILTKHCKHE